MNESSDLPGAGSEGGRPEDAGHSVDEKFARLAAEIDGSRVEGAGPKEESARTRRLRAEWSKNPPQAQPWRSDGRGGASEPGQAGFAQPRRDPRRRARNSVKVLCGLALVGVIAYGFWPRSHTPAPVNASPAGTASPWAAAEAAAGSPSPSASPSQSFTNPDDAYFAGSPALSWADNEAGFALPSASALNGVSRSEITAGYKLLAAVMEAGNLDATVLNGGSVADYTKLLDPKDGTTRSLESAIAHPSAAHDPVMYVTRFNPANTRLLGHTVKVHGSMSAKAGKEDHSVLLTVDYLFVYAVGPASGDTSQDTRVVMHRTVEIEVVNPNYYEMTPGTAWLYEYSYADANSKCYDHSGYVDPAFGDDNAAPNAPGTVDPYATGNLLTASPESTSTAEVCQALSGGV